MDYDGLFPKFPVNRPLDGWELSHRLRQGKPARAQPWQQFSLIRMNSTYLECVDKFFEARGMLTAAGLFFSVLFLGTLAIPVDMVFSWLTMPPEDQRGSVFLLAFILFLCLPVLYVCLRFMFFKEAFRYTHYPMRFNRKNRMVYVTRFDGTVMAEPWDKLFFALGDMGKGAHDIRMHRLDADVAGLEPRELMHHLSTNTVNVLETHALTYFSDAHDPNLLAQWEFIRQYMENGPAPFMDDITVVMDVHDRRESFVRGFLRLHTSSGALGFLVLPVDLVYAVGRWLANITSKIPRWPEEVERECRIAPDDPYIRDRDNLATQAEYWAAQDRREEERSRL